jgi:hypothetical protein
MAQLLSQPSVDCVELVLPVKLKETNLTAAGLFRANRDNASCAGPSDTRHTAPLPPLPMAVTGGNCEAAESERFIRSTDTPGLKVADRTHQLS